MGSIRPIRVERRPPGEMHAHAADQLRYIRETMEDAASFTAVPGWAGVAIGCLALATAAVASQLGRSGWLWIWLGTLAISTGVAITAARRKTARMRVPGGPARKFARSFAPAMAAGGTLTFALHVAGHDALLPGLWLLLYGVAVMNAGAHSVRPVPALGLSAMAVGAAALFSPAAWGDAYMAAGFGLLNIGYGFWIARNYGG